MAGVLLIKMHSFRGIQFHQEQCLPAFRTQRKSMQVMEGCLSTADQLQELAILRILGKLPLDLEMS